MRRWLSVSPVIAVAAAAALGVSFAGAQTAPPPAKPAGQCFAMRDWRGWKASPDSKALYIRTGVNEVYRLDLDFACPELQGPDPRLITRGRGDSDFVCSPLDLDLSVRIAPGFSSPCQVKSISLLTPDQVAALPPKLKP
jgi:hypothetical protein